MKTRWIPFLVVASSFLLLPAAARAQSSITGVVRDSSAAVLPGVTVEAASPALIERVRSTVTDAQGRYRIVDLRPGTYTVSFTLTGFTTSRREGLELPAEFTATINADLAVGTLQETVTVSGEAPTVDLRTSRAQVQFAQETLQSLPGTGRLATLPAIIPGVTLRRESDRGVGGLSDRTQTAYSMHGAPEAQPVVDGVNHQVASLTSGVFVYNQINIQEVVVETSGVGADRDTGGMQLNMIPRDGGNVFSGLASFAYVGPSLETSNINDDLLARHLDPKRVGSIKKFRDSAGALGGPISRDKLWFFGSFREGVTQQYAEGLYFNKLTQPQSLLYEPDLNRPVNSNDYSRDLSVRFTWQAAPKHKIVLTHSMQPNCNCRFNLLLAFLGEKKRIDASAARCLSYFIHLNGDPLSTAHVVKALQSLLFSIGQDWLNGFQGPRVKPSFVKRVGILRNSDEKELRMMSERAEMPLDLRERHKDNRQLLAAHVVVYQARNLTEIFDKLHLAIVLGRIAGGVSRAF